MSAIKCESCGAPLSVIPGTKYVICEYCGTQTVIENPNDTTSFLPQNNSTINDNEIIISIPSCGSSIFQKKTFNVYRHYAELIDQETGFVEQHMELKDIVKYSQVLGVAMIVFKMTNGQRIFIKCLYEGKAKEILNVLSTLI